MCVFTDWVKVTVGSLFSKAISNNLADLITPASFIDPPANVGILAVTRQSTPLFKNKVIREISKYV